MTEKRKPGRPRQQTVKRRVIQVLVTEGELAELDRQAAKEGQRPDELGVWLRRLGLERARGSSVE